MFIENLKPLTNYDIINLANELKISNFRGVFMRDTLPSKVNDNECGILNLDISKNNGTHWVCYYKNSLRRTMMWGSKNCAFIFVDGMKVP